MFPLTTESTCEREEAPPQITRRPAPLELAWSAWPAPVRKHQKPSSQGKDKNASKSICGPLAHKAHFCIYIVHSTPFMARSTCCPDKATSFLGTRIPERYPTTPGTAAASPQCSFEGGNVKSSTVALSVHPELSLGPGEVRLVWFIQYPGGRGPSWAGALPLWRVGHPSHPVKIALYLPHKRYVEVRM